MWMSVKWTNEKSPAARAAGGFSAVATAPRAPTVRNERLFKRLVELVPEAQHHHVHVRDASVGLPRRRQQRAARRLHGIAQPSLRIDEWARQNLIVDEPLRHAPV